MVRYGFFVKEWFFSLQRVTIGRGGFGKIFGQGGEGEIVRLVLFGGKKMVFFCKFYYP